MAMAPSMPPPLLWKAAETGTMQAEQRFITGPTASPFAVRLNTLPEEKPLPLPEGNRKRLRQSRDQEGEDHAYGDEPQVGHREYQPPVQEGGARLPLDAEPLEALHLRRGDGLKVTSNGF